MSATKHEQNLFLNRLYLRGIKQNAEITRKTHCLDYVSPIWDMNEVQITLCWFYVFGILDNSNFACYILLLQNSHETAVQCYVIYFTSVFSLPYFALLLLCFKHQCCFITMEGVACITNDYLIFWCNQDSELFI